MILKDADKKLRKGFTTGACAAAGARAAAQALFATGKPARKLMPGYVPVTIPSGDILSIRVKSIKVDTDIAVATVIKDAGDDPDVTNGAEIITEVRLVKRNAGRLRIMIKGGQGVGVVTRPGLKIPPGKPAINPVPLMMIRGAVLEAAKAARLKPSVVVTVSVPKGKRLAGKTMNPRLGITGGISILGTTGIVEPMSLSAYRHSISCAMDVAEAGGCDEVVFSTGRSTEKAVDARLGLPEIAYVLTGDHMGFALKYAAKRKKFRRVTIAGQFGKMSKLAAGHFETHCSDSSVEFELLARLCKELGAGEIVKKKVLGANTAREVFFILKEVGLEEALRAVCRSVKENAIGLVKAPFEVRSMLVGYNNEIICSC